MILLDRHPATAAVPLLSPRELGINMGREKREAGGHPLDDREHGGAVGLPRRREPHVPSALTADQLQTGLPFVVAVSVAPYVSVQVAVPLVRTAEN